MISPRGVFWLFVAVGFFAMTCQTIWVRQVVVPQALEESRGKVASIMGVPVSDVTKLKGIFDDTLLVEIIAFALSAAAAFFELLEPKQTRKI